MKNAVIFLMMLVSVGVQAQNSPTPKPAPVFTLSIVNKDGLVSPGGTLYYSIVGSATNDYGQHTWISPPRITTDGLADTSSEDKYNHSHGWLKGQSHTHPVYGRVSIKRSITSITLPKTLQLKLSYGSDKTSTVSFTLKADGTHGHRSPDAPASGYYLDIHFSDDGYLHTPWYEFICINNEGNCPINIKNTKPDKYRHGYLPFHPQHTCSDAGWPISSMPQQRVPIIFDIRRLRVLHKGEHVPDDGHVSHDSVSCRFTSSAPFLLRPVQPEHIALNPLP